MHATFYDRRGDLCKLALKLVFGGHFDGDAWPRGRRKASPGGEERGWSDCNTGCRVLWVDTVQTETDQWNVKIATVSVADLWV